MSFPMPVRALAWIGIGMFIFLQASEVNTSSVNQRYISGFIHYPEIQLTEKEKYKLLSQERIQKELGIPKPLKTYYTQPKQVSSKDLQCLAMNIYYEAIGEERNGMIGVAQITLNRLKTKRWGKNICSVVYAKKQFSWTRSKTKRYKVPKGKHWIKSQKIAKEVLAGLRLKGLENILHYHADWIPHPSWSQKMKVHAVIGQHLYLHP